MSSRYKYLAIALIALLVGWFAAREHLGNPLSSTPGVAASNPAAPATTPNESPSIAREESKNAGVWIPVRHSSMIVLDNPMLTLNGPAAVMMTVHAKNNGTQALDQIAASFQLVSPGQTIPLAANGHIQFHIQGSLAPGEEKDISTYDLSFGTLRQRRLEHPEAILTVSPTAAWGAKPSVPSS